MKKIVIAAGTGFLGKVITNYFKPKVETIIILTRGVESQQENIRYINWDAKTIGPWQKELDGADVLINMAGKSVDCRYHQKNKKLILSSRVDATKILGEAIQNCINPPKIWLNSSTATIYRHSMDKEMDEETGEIGSGFSVSVAKAWEKSFFETQIAGIRKIALRTSIVLGSNGGALPPIVNLVKIGFGGRQGSGKQKFSWIHEIDFVRSIEFIIQNKDMEGPINIVSPTPITNAQLMSTIRNIKKAPLGIPLSKPLLELGARIIKTETELILKSRNVIPQKLINKGFQFHFPEIQKTIKNLI